VISPIFCAHAVSMPHTAGVHSSVASRGQAALCGWDGETTLATDTEARLHDDMPGTHEIKRLDAHALTRSHSFWPRHRRMIAEANNLRRQIPQARGTRTPCRLLDRASLRAPEQSSSLAPLRATGTGSSRRITNTLQYCTPLHYHIGYVLAVRSTEIIESAHVLHSEHVVDTGEHLVQMSNFYLRLGTNKTQQSKGTSLLGTNKRYFKRYCTLL
jgi:hypothetical protein